MLKNFSIIVIFFLLPFVLTAQNITDDSLNILGSTIVESGDTLPNYNIKEVKVFPKKEFKNRRHRRRYSRLIRNVKKAYPFSVVARNELRIMNDSLKFIKGESAQRRFIKEYEKEMFAKYEDGLRKLTFSQGRILLKLVDREIGETSYVLVKEYRGDFSAFFWQGVARIFGSNLKSTYDPLGEDAEIELIIQMIEAGVI